MKVCLISHLHLSINPRLWKEAFFYEREGFDVIVLTMWQSEDLLDHDLRILEGHNIEYMPFLDFRPGHISSLARNLYRFRRRLAGELQKIFRISTKWSIGHAPEKMLKVALEVDADLYAAHLECAFYVGRDLVRAGKNVSFDFEDWYSKDYLVPERAVNLLNNVEKFALDNGIFCTASSDTMAASLKKFYKTSKPIFTIYNSFPEQEVFNFAKKESSNSGSVLQMIWTSRTIGSARGLETLIIALNEVKTPVILNLIGKCDVEFSDYLCKNWPIDKGHELVFHDFIPHNELLQSISNYDLGLAIEEYIPDSRNTTVTNKILQYLQAGLLVLATDTDGQKEVACNFPDSVFLVAANNPTEWAMQIEIIATGFRSVDKLHQRKIFNDLFSWSKQEEKFRLILGYYL